MIDWNEKKYDSSEWLIPLCCRTAALQNPIRFPASPFCSPLTFLTSDGLSRTPASFGD